jgi:hypothetical protein
MIKRISLQKHIPYPVCAIHLELFALTQQLALRSKCEILVPLVVDREKEASSKLMLNVKLLFYPSNRYILQVAYGALQNLHSVPLYNGPIERDQKKRHGKIQSKYEYKNEKTAYSKL